MFISVVMLAYNAEKTIKQSIESVLAQTYRDFEFIIINDSSTDNTEHIICEYAKKDQRIRYYKDENKGGVSFLRNLGSELSCGEYVAYIDSDDLWLENKLYEQVEFIKNNKDAKFVFTGSGLIDGAGNSKSHIISVPQKVALEELLKQNIISCSSVLIKRELLGGAFSGDDTIHEDYAAWLKILKEEKYAYGINKPLLTYRLTEGSRSRNKFKAAIMTWRVYKHIDLKLSERIYFMFFYAIRSIKKYIKIYGKH